jgi:hypothetical protein
MDMFGAIVKIVGVEFVEGVLTQAKYYWNFITILLYLTYLFIKYYLYLIKYLLKINIKT